MGTFCRATSAMLMHSASRTANDRLSLLASVRSTSSRSRARRVHLGPQRRGSGPLLGIADDVPDQPDAVPDRPARRGAVLEGGRPLAGQLGAAARAPRPARARRRRRAGRRARPARAAATAPSTSGAAALSTPASSESSLLRPAERLRLRMTRS